MPKLIPIILRVEEDPSNRSTVRKVEQDLKSIEKNAQFKPFKFHADTAGLKDAERSLGGIHTRVADIAKSLPGGVGQLAGQIGGASGELAAFGGVAGVAGAAVIGLGVALAGATLALAKTAAELKLTSQITGLSVSQLQTYENAARVAGVSASTLSEGVLKYRERARDALAGNFQLAQSFSKLGLDIKQAITAPGDSFEKFLDQLQAIPEPMARVAQAQKILGDENKDFLRVVIALTENQGELRKQLEATGVALSDQAVNDLAKLNREYELLTITVGNFSKRALVEVGNEIRDTADAFRQGRIAAGIFGPTVVKQMQEGNYFTAIFGETIGKWVGEQQKAPAAINATTNAIQNQTGALEDLVRILPSVRISTTQKAVSEAIAEIAVQAKTTQEGVQTFYRKVATDENFRKTVTDNIRYAEILKAVNKAATPDSGAAPRARTSRAAGALSELQQLQKQLSEINKDLLGFQAVGSQEFKLRIQLENARGLKSDLETILRLRRSLGEAVAAPFPRISAGARDEIAKLEALKKAREGLAKIQADPLGPVAEITRARTAAIGDLITNLDKLVADALPKATDATYEQALATNQDYLALQKIMPLLAEQYQLDIKDADAKRKQADETQRLAAIRDQLTGQLESLNDLTIEQTTALRLQKEGITDLTSAEAQNVIQLARQIDQRNLFKEQMEAAQRATEQFRQNLVGLFETLFNDGPKKFFDNVLSLLKRTLSRMLSELIASQAMKILGFGGQTAAAAGASRSVGSAPAATSRIQQALGSFRISGGQGASLAIPGAPNIGPFTPPFAGGSIPGLPGGGGFQIPGIGGQGGLNLGGLLRRIPGLGRLFGPSVSSFDKFLTVNPGGGLPEIPVGQAASRSAAGAFNFAGLGATGLLAGGGILGSFLGGKSQVGRLLGGVGGSLAAGGVGALLSPGLAAALPAFFSNPITAIIGGALLGGALLARLFGDKTLKSLRGLIKGEYAIDVKSNKVLENVKALGESKFGKEFKKKQLETIRLAETRELLVEYAERTGQKGNAKLISNSGLQDPFNPANRFKVEAVKRQSGGPIPYPARGYDHIPALLDGGEFVLNRDATAREGVAAVSALNAGQARITLNAPARSQDRGIVPTAPQSGGQSQSEEMTGLIRANVTVMAALLAQVSRLQGIPKGQMIEQGLRENPGAAARAMEDEFRNRSSSSAEIRRMNSIR